MQPLKNFKEKVDFLLTDIDDTMTDEGLLGSAAYQSIWNLRDAGMQVIPVTGRPAGWCEMIARTWPVAGVVGENGGFYFRYHRKKMIRNFFFTEKDRMQNKEKLGLIQSEILQKVKGAAVASDQFCRLMDLAIDFCEDVSPLGKSKVQQIVDIFTQHGATAKVSSIHVNGWFGKYDKLTQSLNLLKSEFSMSTAQAKKVCAFCGDSPNDEPMWAFFPHAFSVANISEFQEQITHKPAYVSSARGGKGFSQIAKTLLQKRRTSNTALRKTALQKPVR